MQLAFKFFVLIAIFAFLNLCGGQDTVCDNSMGSVRAVIAARKARHDAEDPFIQWLRSIEEPKKDTFRSIAMVCVNFHLGFSDICRALSYQNATSPFMRAINRHTEQDGTHYQLIIHDLHELGLDEMFTASELLRVMYSGNNTASRDLVVSLMSLGEKANVPAVRYAMMESMEEHGNVLFSTYFELVKRLTDTDPNDMFFFGEKHLLLESGHLMNQEDNVNEVDLFDTLILTSEEHGAAVEVAHATWDAFEKWQAGMFSSIQKLPDMIRAAKIDPFV